MIPIAISLAINLGLDPRPFVIATYRLFGKLCLQLGIKPTLIYMVLVAILYDFTKVGLPLNIICFIVATFIPMFGNFIMK